MHLFSIAYLIIFFTCRSLKLNGSHCSCSMYWNASFIFLWRGVLAPGFFIFGIGMITFVVFVILFTVCVRPRFSADGPACRPFSWRWSSARSNTGSMAIIPNKTIAIPCPGTGRRSASGPIVHRILCHLFPDRQFLPGYHLISMDKLIGYITHPGGHVGTLISLLIFLPCSSSYTGGSGLSLYRCLSAADSRCFAR